MKFLFSFFIGCFSIYAINAQALDDSAKTKLLDLLYQDCGSCHGMRLTGGLGPALTQKQLSNKDETYLFATISEGHIGTPMPPWKYFLSKQEITWLVNYLKTTETHQMIK